jgi:hypothetical protein
MPDEGSIKPALSRRFPEESTADAVQAVAMAAIAAIPAIGGSMTELVSLVLAPSVDRRREVWFRELAEALEALQAMVDGFRIEDLQTNEEFISGVIQATRSAVSTHRHEKREALRNALLNIALHRSADADTQETFLRYIDELSVWHLQLLWLFQDPPRAIASVRGSQTTYGMGAPAQILETVYPRLASRRDIYDQIASDLYSRGFLNASRDFLHTMMTGSGMIAKRTTQLADDFLRFIASPSNT